MDTTTFDAGNGHIHRITSECPCGCSHLEVGVGCGCCIDRTYKECELASTDSAPLMDIQERYALLAGARESVIPSLMAAQDAAKVEFQRRQLDSIRKTASDYLRMIHQEPEGPDVPNPNPAAQDWDSSETPVYGPDGLPF